MSLTYRGALVSVPPPLAQPARPDPCLRMFALGKSQMFWEQPSPDSPASCLGSGLPPKHSTPCLTSLRRRRGRPASVMLIGDSRARIIFVKLHDTLELVWRQDILDGPFQLQHNATFWERGQQVRCPTSVPLRFFFQTAIERYVCHLEAQNDLVHATFHWTPFVSAGYAERLAVVEEDCRSGLACPDLVVMTLGMWYSKKTAACKNQAQAECLLYFRDELEKLVAVLQRLSKRTQIVYRIDGPDFLDGGGVKSPSNDAILTTTAVTTETLRQKVRTSSRLRLLQEAFT